MAPYFRSTECQMRSQSHFISVRGQKIICWKLGQGCNFGSNGPIYIFSFIFCTPFCFVLFYFLKKKSFLFFLKICFNFFFYLFIYLFIIGSNGLQCTSLSLHLTRISGLFIQTLISERSKKYSVYLEDWKK